MLPAYDFLTESVYNMGKLFENKYKGEISMKKLKWLLVLLLACCFIGCGKSDESESSKKDNTEESGEETKEKDDNDDDEDKKDKKTAAGHEVSADNVADIFGLWYDKNNEWNLLIFNNDYEDFPDIGRAVLTNGYENYLLCLDEKGRKGKDTIGVCDENGKSYKANMTFTEDGILLDSISKLGTKEMMFVRDGLYGSEPVGGNHYSTRYGAHYRVIQQVIGDGKTYYLLEDYDTGENVMAYVNNVDNTYYVDSFFCTEEANVFYEQMLKGFPVVQLVSYNILSEEEFYDWYYGFGEEGEHDGDVDVYTPVCNFPKEYDWSYYDEDTGLWVVANMESQDRFSMAGIELLEWEDDQIRLIGRVKNNTSRQCEVWLDIYCCNAEGETLTTTGSYVFYGDGEYGVDRETWRMDWSGFRAKLPAGKEGFFAIDNANAYVDVFRIREPICYVYIKLRSYYETY